MARNLIVNGVTYNNVESLEMTAENGEKVLYTESGTDGVQLPELTNPADSEQIVQGYEAIDPNGAVITGTNPYEKTATDTEVQTQSNQIRTNASLIEQIKTALISKVAGGDNALEDTLVGGIAQDVVAEYSNERVTTIRAYIFNGFGNLQSINLPNVETIGQYAFNNCAKLTEIDLPRCTEIGAYAFAGCKAMTKANLPLLQTVGQYAFAQDAILTEFTAPLLTSIERQAFYFCNALTKLDFHSLTTIAVYGCANSRSLTAVIIRTPTVCSLQNVNAFNGTPIASGTGYVYVPAALVDSYKAATNWSTYANQIRAIEDYPDITGGG